MAVWAKIDTNQPIRNGGAYGDAPRDKSTTQATVQGQVENLEITGYHTLLNGKYKTGATTGWERPGSNLT